MNRVRSFDGYNRFPLIYLINVCNLVFTVKRPQKQESFELLQAFKYIYGMFTNQMTLTK